jgi:DtxR family transcriptional regulator, Mn-dependent transcriptional regulator
MVKKLSGKRLINYEPYQGVTLTPSGRRLALKMVRRHRLWEMFLVKFLGYTWDEIHNEAELLEHVTSDDLEERIDKALGYPKVDPHGDPIPTSAGDIIEVTYKNLSDCIEREEGIVVRVKDESHEILKYMTKLGLSLNKKIVVMQKIQFDGSVIVEIDGHEVALSEKLAQSIFVQTA